MCTGFAARETSPPREACRYMKCVNWLIGAALRYKYNLHCALNIHKYLSCFWFLEALHLIVTALVSVTACKKAMMGSDEGKGGNKLNPNAPEFYPTAYPCYPFYCASQLPRNLPVTDPPFPRFTPTTQALHATGCKLVAFNVDATLPNRFLHEKFQRFGM